MSSLPTLFESWISSASAQITIPIEKRAMTLEPGSMSSGRSRSMSVRSLSVSSMASSLDTSGIDVEDLDLMDSLVADVRRFSDSVTQLSTLVEQCALLKTERRDTEQPYCVRVHDALNQVSRGLKDLLRYHFLRSPQVLTPAANLVHRIKELKLDVSYDLSHEEAIDAIKTLEAAVAERLRTYLVGDYLSWEMSQDDLKLSHSTDDLSTMNSNGSNQDSAVRRQIRNKSIQRRHSTFAKSNKDFSPEQLDQALVRLNSGVDLAFERSKLWSKYCKEILNFAQRRISLETEHAKSVQKLSDSTRLLIQDEEFLPLKDIFMDSFKLESEFYQNCTDSMKRLYEYKFIKPLEGRRAEHELKRKSLRIQWEKHCKQVQDITIELKKAKHSYAIRDMAYKKARENSLKTEMTSAGERDRMKVERKRKAEEDAMLRREQAINDCQTLETRLDQKYQELERVKANVIRELRELIYQCDQTTKACTVAYFQAFSGLWALLPLQYQHLSDSAKAYTPGMEYMNFVQSIPNVSHNGPWKNRAASDEDLSLLPKFRASRPMLGGVKSNPTFAVAGNSGSSFYDPEDDEGSPYSEICPKGKSDLARAISESSCSPAALSHSLQKLRLPAKCGHCDSYTFFQTVQCAECGMTWHKSCLNRVEVHCGPSAKTMSASARRMSVFGVPLENTNLDTQTQVPLIVEKCIEELDNRGAQLKGIYRVSGVKSKIEQLCENFERCNVDLRNVHPTNIASVVKLYLRQLPDPLLTFALYNEFIQYAKTFQTEQDEPYDSDQQNEQFLHSVKVAQLKHLVGKLPKQNYETLKFLIRHLRRMTWFASENQMTASNMGIVFGPTLLWKEENDVTLLTGLLEAPNQARVVELLITLVYEIFDVDENEEKTLYRHLYDQSILNITEADPADVVSKLQDESGESTLGDEDRPIVVEKPRKSATPDLLKLPPHKKTSATSSENGGVTISLGGQSLSDDETESTDMQFSVSPGGLSGFDDTSDSDRLIGSVRSRGNSQFERGRPLRGATRQQHLRNKGRSYTTSILVSPSLTKKIILPPRHASFDVADTKSLNSSPSDSVTVSPTKGQLLLNNPEITKARTDSDLCLQQQMSCPEGELKRATKDTKNYLDPVGLIFSGEEISYV